jgi:mRNA interferase MazF
VNRGDIIWLDFDPVLGHEQGGRRPGLVVSEISFHRITKKVLVCPVTRSDARGYLFHVQLDARTLTRGSIMCDHARSMDIGFRDPEFIESVPEDILSEVIDTLVGILGKSPVIVYQPE